jgi:hypothetical protein
MSAADCKRARKRMMLRYSAGKRRSVAQAIAAERNAAKRQAAREVVRKK